MIDIDKATAPFEGAVITKLEMDPFNTKVLIEAKVMGDNDKAISTHKLEVLNCQSFLWTGYSDFFEKQNTDFKDCNYYEVTAINYKPVLAGSTDEWLSQYNLNYNIIIEIWDNALLIRAQTVIIDGTTFKI